MHSKASLIVSFVLCAALFLGFGLPRTNAQSSDFWVYGTVATTPIATQYNGVNCTEFNMSVTQSNGVTPPLTMDVLVPSALLLNLPVPVSTTLNLTGATGQAGFPAQDFVASQVTGAGSPDIVSMAVAQLVSIVKWFFAFIGNATQSGMQQVANLVQTNLHITLPPALLTLIGILAIAVLFVLAFKKIPWPISVILFFLAVAMVSSLATTLNLL